MFILLIILLSISIFLEATFISIPLSLSIILCLTIIAQEKALIISFLAGLVIDILSVHRLGSTSFLFLVFSCLIILYQRKYEINSYPFVLVSSFIGSVIYLFLLGRSSLIIAFLGSAFTLLLFIVSKITILKTKNKKYL